MGKARCLKEVFELALFELIRLAFKQRDCYGLGPWSKWDAVLPGLLCVLIVSTHPCFQACRDEDQRSLESRL